MANIPISSFTAAANATGIGMSGFSLTGTNAQSMLDLAGTWNTTGTPTGIKLNVTDTASNAASLLADLQVGGTSRFNVTKAGTGYFAGNLGVGTTSPGTRLETSTTSAGATAEVFRLSNPGAGANTQAQMSFSTTATTYGTITGGYGAAAPQMTFNLPSATAGNYVWQISSTERMRIDTGGNVGIGTNSPGALLDVNGTARAGNFRVNAGGSVTGAGIWGIDTILAFNTGSTERMRIDSAGNLGVGTATPGYLVQVGSRISLGNDGVIQWGSAFTGTSRGFLSWDTTIASINAASNLVLASNGTTERVRITETGRVGVGTNSPEATFTVAGAAGAITGAGLAVVESSTGNNARLRIFQSAGFVTYDATYSSGGNQHVWSNAGVERMRLTEAGNLGIGTSAPTAKLSVGDAAAAKLNLMIGASERAYIDYTEATALMRVDSDAAMAFNTNNTERMRIDTNGNVGVNTTPSPWDTASRAIEIGNTVSLARGGASEAELAWNTYVNTSAQRIYKLTAAASFYQQLSGNHSWFTAPSGTAGAVATFTERMRVKNTGQVRFVPLASAPAGAEAGDVYYDSGTNKLRCYNGTIWNDLF